MSIARTPPSVVSATSRQGWGQRLFEGSALRIEGIVNNRISKKIGRKRGPAKRTSSLAMFLGAPFSDDGGVS
jgi:hypothetical protein